MQDIKPITSSERLANLEAGISAHREALSVLQSDAKKPIVAPRPNVIKAGINNITNKFFPKKDANPKPSEQVEQVEQVENVASKHSLDDDLKQLIHSSVVEAVVTYEEERIKKMQYAEAQERLNKLNSSMYGKQSSEEIDDIAVRCRIITDTPEARAGFRNTARHNPDAVKKLLKDAMEKQSRIEAEHQLDLIRVNTPDTLEERGKKIYDRLSRGALDKEMAIMPAEVY